MGLAIPGIGTTSVRIPTRLRTQARRVGGQWLGRQATNGPEGDGAGVATKEHLRRRDRRAGSYRCAHTGELEEPPPIDLGHPAVREDVACSVASRRSCCTPTSSVRRLSIADFLIEGAIRPEEVGDLHSPARAGRELADVHAPQVIADPRWPLKP